jgi:hypothetical protein
MSRGGCQGDIAFATELEYVHFLYVESSFDVMHVEYAPTEKVIRAVGAGFAEHVDIVRFGQPQEFYLTHPVVCNTLQVATAPVRQV